MKALLVLVLLSIASYANASVDLSCYAEGLTRTDPATMIQENGVFKVVQTIGFGQNKTVETTMLYPKGKAKRNSLGDMVYSGVAERQVQVDVFAKSNFGLKVPQILQNRTVLTYTNDAGEETGRMEFRCSRPDNR